MILDRVQWHPLQMEIRWTWRPSANLPRSWLLPSPALLTLPRSCPCFQRYGGFFNRCKFSPSHRDHCCLLKRERRDVLHMKLSLQSQLRYTFFSQLKIKALPLSQQVLKPAKSSDATNVGFFFKFFNPWCRLNKNKISQRRLKKQLCLAVWLTDFTNTKQTSA